MTRAGAPKKSRRGVDFLLWKMGDPRPPGVWEPKATKRKENELQGRIGKKSGFFITSWLWGNLGVQYNHPVGGGEGGVSRSGTCKSWRLFRGGRGKEEQETCINGEESLLTRQVGSGGVIKGGVWKKGGSRYASENIISPEQNSHWRRERGYQSF